MIEKDFLAQILATPDDDAPRLVFADWLEERGNLDRAQFIRAQCDLAKLPAWHPRAVEAAWEAEALLAKGGDAWRAELPQLGGIEWGDFERGFVTMVRVRDQEALYEHASAIAAATPISGVELPSLDEKAPHDRAKVPWLETLRLTFRGDYAFQIRSSILSAAPALEIENLHQYTDLDWLARRQPTAPLHRLEISGSHIASSLFTERIVEHVPAAWLQQLDLGTKFVDFDSGYFQDPTLGADGAALIAARKFENLSVLGLDRQRITQQGLGALLAASPRVRQLELRRCELTELSIFQASEDDHAPIVRLGLSYNQFGDTGVEALVQAPRLHALESLELETCELTAASVTALAGSPLWQTLRVLDLGRNPLALDAAVALAGAPRPEHLHTLVLADCDLGPDAAKLLAGIPWLRDLAVLDLSGNELGGDAILLAESLAGGSLKKLGLARVGLDATPRIKALRPLWESLWHLDVSGNAFGDTGLLALVGESSALYSLDLGATGAGPALGKLATAPLPRLHKLVLSGCAPTQAILRTLLASPLMRTLRELDLSSCALTKTEVMMIAQSPAVSGLDRLNLRANAFEDDEQVFLALADSEHLRKIRHLELDGNHWSFSEPARERLTERFGAGWHWHEDGEDDDAENPYA
ncbi:MAG TPA: TIGR02996 domain-containing protein [Kofleriaceae bacterium]